MYIPAFSLLRSCGRALALLVLPALLSVALECRGSVIYSITIDTTPWSGQSGSLAFDLIGGDAAVANNTASISALATNGTLSSVADFSLTDMSFFNEVLRDATFGTSLNFTLQLTDNHTAPGFDQFSFFLLGSGGLPLVHTNDPTGADALFAFDFTGTSGSGLSTFASIVPGGSWTITTETTAGVPDNGTTWPLFGGVLVVLSCVSKARQRKRVVQ